MFIQISESQIGRAIRTSRWKYSVCAPGGNAVLENAADCYIEEFLYDLEADPHELCNLIGYASHREVSAVMRKRLLRYIQEVEGYQPDILSAQICESGQRIVTAEETML